MSWVLFSLPGWFVLQSPFCSPSYVERCCNLVSRLLSRYWCTRALQQFLLSLCGSYFSADMRDDTAMNTQNRKIIGRWISIAIVASAVVVGFVVLYRTNYYPRTDDAEIFANFIGIAPQVDGPLVRLNVKDNQIVKTGDLLYEIDERPYQYGLENALSEQAALEGQIADEQRKIAALVSGVSVAQENIHSAEAEVTDAERGVGRARAEWTYAKNNLHRLEPLLVKQFVTVDQVDKARSSETAMAEALRQAESQMTLS